MCISSAAYSFSCIKLKLTRFIKHSKYIVQTRTLCYLPLKLRQHRQTEEKQCWEGGNSGGKQWKNWNPVKEFSLICTICQTLLFAKHSTYTHPTYTFKQWDFDGPLVSSCLSVHHWILPMHPVTKDLLKSSLTFNSWKSCVELYCRHGTEHRNQIWRFTAQWLLISFVTGL